MGTGQCINVYGKTPKATKERDTIKLFVKLYSIGKLNFFWQGVVKYILGEN